MAGPIRIAILANGSQAKRELASVNGSLGKLGGIAKSAAAVGFGALIYGAGKFAKSAVDVERQFSTSMRTLQASTGASADEMAKLNKAAIDLGAGTSFSAGEAAKAMLELGKSGFSSAEILKSVPEVMNLAATEGIELERAAGLVTSSLAQFGLKAGDSAQVVNALAGAATASRSSVAGLGESMKLVGSAGAGVGLSVQETAAALAALSQAGLDGSVAGTSLASVFNHLVPQTTRAKTAMRDLNLDFTDAKGNFDDIDTIAAKLAGTFGDMDEESRKLKIAKIFGNDASTIAAVNALISSGAKGLREFTKASEDNNAAQRLAEARMGGTEGALERLSGAIETAQLRLGQEFAPAIVAGADALGDKLVPALETAIDAGKDIGNALAPAFEEIAEALGNLAGEGDTVAHLFEDVFIPALTLASEAVGAVVDFIDDLPGPVKELAAQVGLAALVWPRLSGAIATTTGAMTLNIAKMQQFRAEMSYTATRAQITGAALQKMAGLARGAAGIGGMVALTQAASETNNGLKALEKTAGGVLLGFAAGGPVGAAIGGVAGLAASFNDLQGAFEDALGLSGPWADETASIEASQKRAAEATERHLAAIEALTATFNQAKVTAATLEPAYANVVAQLDAAGINAETADQQWRLLGISQRTVAQASVGNASALRKINQAYASAPLANRIINEHTLADAIDNTTVTNRQAIQEERQRLRLTQEWAGKLKALPKKARTAIQLDGVQPTVRGIARVVHEHKKIDGKDIKTILEVTGVDASVRDIKKAARELDTTDRKTSRPKLDADDKNLRAKTAEAMRSLRTLDHQLASPASTLKLDEYYRRRSELLASLRSIPDEFVTIWVSRRDIGGSGGNTGGSGGNTGGGRKPTRMLADSVLGPMPPLLTEVEARGQAVVAAFARSVSRSMERAGQRAGQSAVQGILAGVVGGSDAIANAIEKINRLIEKRTKDDKAGNARQKAILKHLADEYRALKRNGKAQDEINRKLERAKEHLREVKGWVDGVKQSFIDTGNVTQLGVLDDGTVSGSLMIDQLRDQVAQAEQFAQLIRDLTDADGPQINQTTLQQLLTAGPQAGLATAQALASGGDAAIDEINTLTAQLAATGQQLGSQMSDQFFDVGLQAAQGLIDGLEAKQKQLDRIARRLANQLADAIRRALGIHSPSRVFQDIGDQTIKGLVIGLDETYARRAGSATAEALMRGFGTPALDAFTSSQSGGVGAQVIRIHLTAEQLSAAQRGRGVLVDVSAARSAGARQLAVSSR